MVVAGLAIGGPAFAQTVHPWGTNPCPPAGDTASLLQPQGPAYADAATFAVFLRAHDFVVHCVTRTTFEGTLGVRSAAGFQTDKGPIAVLFFAGAERVRVQGHKTSRGYRYEFRNPPHPGVGDVLDVNGPLDLVIHGTWFIIAPSAQVAAALVRDVVGK
jgi:hypothetical protein